MKRYQRTAASQYLALVVILISIAGIGLLGSLVMSRVPFVDEFAMPWAAGRAWLLLGESPYEASVTEMALEAIDESPYQATLPDAPAFTKPLLTLVFYLPFSLIPYTVSRVIWMTLLSLCVGFVGYISIRLVGWKVSTLAAIGVVLVVVSWLPSVTAIISGHLAPLIIALMMLGVYLITDQQDTTAGFILALTISSFASSGLILLLLLVWSISTKRWSILAATLSGFVFLTTLSFLILPSWFMSWASVLIGVVQEGAWFSTPLMQLAQLLPGIASFLQIFLHALAGIYALYMLITAFGQTGRPFIYKISGFFIIAYIFHIQGSIIYLPLVIPAMVLVFRFWSERWGKLGQWVSWIALVAVGAGSWLMIYPDVNFSAPIDAPLLTIGYPLFVLLGMVWIRWWALSIPKLPYETQPGGSRKLKP